MLQEEIEKLPGILDQLKEGFKLNALLNFMVEKTSYINGLLKAKKILDLENDKNLVYGENIYTIKPIAFGGEAIIFLVGLKNTEQNFVFKMFIKKEKVFKIAYYSEYLSEKNDLDKSFKIIDKFNSEGKIKHKNLIELKKNFLFIYEEYNNRHKHYVQIMEYCNGLDLVDFLSPESKEKKEKKEKIERKLKEKYQAEQYEFFIIKQIAEGLKHLHDNGLAHRDIKLENIIITIDGVCKILDFGFLTEEKRSKVSCGSFSFAAPELYTENEYDTKKLDIWSFGVVVYILFFKEMLLNSLVNISTKAKNIVFYKSLQDFFVENKGAPNLVQERLNDIIDSANEPSLKETDQEKIRKLAKFILIVDPEKRPNMESIIKKMEELGMFTAKQTDVFEEPYTMTPTTELQLVEKEKEPEEFESESQKKSHVSEILQNRLRDSLEIENLK